MLAPLTAEQNEIFDLRDRVYDLQEALTAEMAKVAKLEAASCSLKTAEDGRTGVSRALACLLGSPDGFRTREQLLGAIGYSDMKLDPKLVDVTICKLRHKLPKGASINTIRGAGYCLTPGSRGIIEGEHG